MKKGIAKKNVDRLKPGEICWDGNLPGFGARCLPSGRVAYILKYRISGHSRWLTIGQHGPLTPEDARKKAISFLGDVGDGIDPAEVKAREREAITVASLCDIYLAEGCATKKTSTLQVDKGRINRHIIPLLGRKKVKNITRGDIERFMRDVADGKTAVDIKTGKQGRSIVTGGKGTASRTVGLLGGIFTFAVNRGFCQDNPARGVKRFKDGRNDRYLSEKEYAKLGKALARAERDNVIPSYAIAAIRLLALTGARRSEILSLRWEFVDIERGLLNLPDSKTGHKTIILNAQAVQILRNIPKIDGNPYVICGQKTGEHLVNLRKIWVKILGLAKLKDARLHDLRHSFASMGVSEGLGLPVIGGLLGHHSPNTTKRYAHLAENPMKAGNDAIGNAISAAMNPGDPPQE